jgi:hypothetical protein
MGLQHNVFMVAVCCTAALAACTDGGKRPLGASCGDSTECESGLCLEGTCVDPNGDEDGDGLTNGIEAALGTI